MLDCIIIGSGPAGISAALTLKANGKSFILLGKKSLSAKIEKAELISNYPGLYAITGQDFCAALQDQLAREEIEVVEQKATGVYAMKDKFFVTAEGDNTYESRTVILASGVETVKAIEGEEAFLGRGVSYCATCDGMLYKDKTIAVFCTTKALEHEVEYLASLAKKVYLLPLYKGVEVEGENIEKIVKMPEKVEGGLRAERLTLKGGQTLEVDGIFMLKDSVSPSALVGGLAVENGHVVVDRGCKTNLSGLFAAGDCTGRPYQYAKAAGEGNVAAHAAIEYLAK
ncbi:MAG: NAD(P)/FAD-dependent oxidoreductase [Clostridia bacterium]|nr:NAD(P)/FAD-dependent oxidoreductase [Clostridia bacterium]